MMEVEVDSYLYIAGACFATHLNEICVIEKTVSKERVKTRKWNHHNIYIYIRNACRWGVEFRANPRNLPYINIYTIYDANCCISVLIQICKEIKLYIYTFMYKNRFVICHIYILFYTHKSISIGSLPQPECQEWNSSNAGVIFLVITATEWGRLPLYMRLYVYIHDFAHTPWEASPKPHTERNSESLLVIPVPIPSAVDRR